ncbi:MAG TPA: glycosyltransferase family 39 protein [Candidatus Udaeobacter sp.]|nr:glycosyltransferase family 39 protein [Candidatus Udaeobacter sp.]
MTHKIDDSCKALRAGWWILAAIVFGVVITIRTRLLGVPLERDEGEYAYAGQLILQGVPPYTLAYNMKFPGTYAAYAAIMSIFGQTLTGIHLGLILVNGATIILIFLLGRQLVNSVVGLAAGMSYAVLSVSPSVLGFAGHATHFVLLPALGGTLLLLKATDRQAFGLLFASGMLFGLGVLMKQPAIFFALFAAIYLVSNNLHRRFRPEKIFLRTLIFSAGVILPLGITCLLLWRIGVFDKFWFWTIDYAGQYGSLVPFSQAPGIFFYSAKEVLAAGWPIWTLAAIGLVTGLWEQRTRTAAVFLLAFLFFSTLALCPGFYFRLHYFILVLPAVSLLAGVAISRLSDPSVDRSVVVRFIPILILGFALTWPILAERKFLFEASPADACRIIYPESPFAESIRIAEYLREHTTRNDTIAVLGSEPQIYFYSNRHSATGYIYTYGLMEPQKYASQMQQEMIRDIERAHPKFLISVVMPDSWLQRPESERLIFTWANEYTAQNYTVAGFVNMVAPDKTDYYFGDVPQSVPQLGKYILIYQRKS